MKIGWFTDTFLPQTNGVVTSLESFGKELSKKHEIHIFCPKSDRKKHLGMTIHSMPSITFPPYPEFKIGITRGKRAPELDVVHTHGPFFLGKFGLRVAKKQDIPKVSTFHTLISEYTTYLSKRAQKPLGKLAWGYCRMHYKNYDKLITPSNAIKKILKEHEISVPIIVIPTGIDLKFLHPIPNARKKLKVKGKTFLYLGRVGYEKKIEVIIKAMAKSKDSKLLIAGKGPATADLKKLTRKLGLNKRIKFLGYVPEKDKPLYMSAVDAFVTASTSETQGMVIYEAMACRTPVIGANSYAIPETIKHGKNGFLFKPGDSEELAGILNDFSASKRMKDSAIKTSKEYSQEKCASKLENFYKRL